MKFRDLTWVHPVGSNGRRSQHIHEPGTRRTFLVWDNMDGTFDLMRIGGHEGDAERLSRLEAAVLIAPMKEGRHP
ncbi:hypothetical protein [Methylobacterium sp. 285MFTsu5.1]|uniref:hypothetical protein n=1 Tax=Methylobacterium sp. 285MFTsu5.1 TaxID=1172187 RepID=UPI0003A73401|nr:hypothetical protein [Methylobacterium sp. 285MFTsu5.1]